MKSARILFTILLIAFTLTLLLITFKYDRKSSVFPFLVTGFSLALGLVVLASELLPGLRELFETNFFYTGSDTTKESGRVNPRDFLIMAFWMILILLSIFLVGFLIALPIWIFSYVRLRGKRPWRYAFLTAIIVWCFVYGFFVKIMGAELFKGLLFGDML